jgi:aminopeptidase N
MKTDNASLFALPLVLAVSLAGVLTACQSPQPKPAAKAITHAEDAEANLTEDEAALRKSLIGEVAYTFDVQLDAKAETFKATSTSTFTLAKAEAIFLDFKNGAKLDAVSINDKTVAVTYLNHRLSLPATYLRVGLNKVTVSYTQTYSHDGRGLHRFVDPEDGNVYLYSQFETYDAHQMFPCFDQPDLKATMTMKVTTPKKWQVITTTRESSVKKVGDSQLWVFPTTSKISTYLFSLHAGPYAKWEQKAGVIPMRLFARQALKKYVRPNEWFVPTRAGLAFYGNYFHYPYPFKKFDEIIAPDFNAGAMENVAAITFTENFVHRGGSTREERESTASVILHEMAHMWFGDLVTMKWWNGLWLNESFATFMSSLSQFHATEFKESWETFYRHEKLWAYYEDQLVITHPIESKVIDVETAFTNFDGITYGKGASTLKQLNFYLGEDHFRDGVRYYFAQHAYTNTSLADFIGALEHVSGKDLQQWSHAWLEDAGLDSVEPVYTCDAGVVSKFELKASGPDGKKTPRVHKTRVRLYDEHGTALNAGHTADIEYHDGLNEVAALKGSPCPSFVDPNDEDHDYVKVKYDGRSLATAQSHVLEIKNDFTRLRIWPNLVQMVRDHSLSPEVYLKVASEALPHDMHLASVEELAKPLAQIYYYLPVSTDAQKTHRTEWVTKFEIILWQRAKAAPAGSDLQKTVLMKYVDLSESKPARDHIANLLEGKEKLRGLDLDTDRRWTMIIHLSALADDRAAALIETQKKKDTSERGIQMALAAEAIRPDLAAKRLWFDTLLTNTDVKFARARAATRNLFPYLQAPMRAQFADEFFEKLPEFSTRRQIDIVDLFVDVFDPTLCTDESAARLAKYLAAHPALPISVVKQMRTDHQETVRCAAIRAGK